MRHHLGLPVLLVAGLAASGPLEGAAQNPPDTGAQTPIDLPAALDRVLRDYERAWEARDAEALAELFTVDGYALRPGRPPVRGHEALVAVYRNSGGPLVLRAYAYAAEGGVGYIIGGFARTADDPDAGKFVLAVRRDANGLWRIAADIDNGNTR